MISGNGFGGGHAHRRGRGRRGSRHRPGLNPKLILPVAIPMALGLALGMVLALSGGTPVTKISQSAGGAGAAPSASPTPHAPLPAVDDWPTQQAGTPAVQGSPWWQQVP